MSSNRTFMELKYREIKTNRTEYASSNRTFMELKYNFYPYWVRQGYVLIAPLWN